MVGAAVTGGETIQGTQQRSICLTFKEPFEFCSVAAIDGSVRAKCLASKGQCQLNTQTQQSNLSVFE